MTTTSHTRCAYRCLAALFIVFLFAMPSAGQAVKRPDILGISHAAIYSKNIDSSLSFYRDLLGYDEPYRLVNPDSTTALVFIKINDLQCIELFPERTANSDRLYQVALITDDAEAMRLYLASCGVKVPEKAGKGRIGNFGFTVKDPDGHNVEIVHYTQDGWTKRDSGKHLPKTRISTHLKHIGISVASLDKAMAFYGDILGFKETWRGSRDTLQLAWVNMKVPEGTDYLEFMLYKEQPSLERLGTMNHMSFEVPDITKAAAELEARPARKHYPRSIEIRTGINRKRQCNLFDPDGTRSELMEPGTIDGKSVPSSTAPAPK
jgi:catechol 2,3-dioxygenase-like lactoylglutathione lyase family enzyme